MTQRSVRFISADALENLPLPFPRSQDCKILETLDTTPLPSDLVVCVSHSWPYQAHPDPLGEKLPEIQALVAAVKKAHKPMGRTLLFFDFLSVAQAPRTADEEASFQAAVQAMPALYCRSDAVVHLETVGSDVDTMGEEHRIETTLGALGIGDTTVNLCASTTSPPTRLREVGGFVQVTGSETVPDFSVVRSIGGAGVWSLADVEKAKAANAPADTPVVCQACPLGLRNVAEGNDRGWLHLERFCSMVKVAMCEGEGEKDGLGGGGGGGGGGAADGAAAVARAAFATDANVLREIRVGGRKLREAAKGGAGPLAAALDEFARAMGAKAFAEEGDAAVVAGLMKDLTAHLSEKWEQEQAGQRQRALVLAVHRGDAWAVPALVAAGPTNAPLTATTVTMVGVAESDSSSISGSSKNKDFDKTATNNRNSNSQQQQQQQHPAGHCGAARDESTFRALLDSGAKPDAAVDSATGAGADGSGEEGVMNAMMKGMVVG